MQPPRRTALHLPIIRPIFLWNIIVLNPSRDCLIVETMWVLIAHWMAWLVRVRHSIFRINWAFAIAQIALVIGATLDSPSSNAIATFAFGCNFVIKRMSFSNSAMTALTITAANRVCRHTNLRAHHNLKLTNSL